jgi:hypothetical protein
MTEREATELAVSYAKAKQIAFSGVEKAVFMSNREWQLDELSMPGDYWFVYLSLVEAPGMVGPHDAVAISVSCSTGAVVVLDN